jgi:hypothetical protein
VIPNFAALALALGGAQDAFPSQDAVRTSLARGLAFLRRDQNPDGSWGSWRNAAHEFWSNPETHRSWIVATTGLACVALVENGKDEASRTSLGRAVDYLLAEAKVKRPSDWDTDNVWAYVYGLQGLARVLADPRFADDPRRPRVRETAQALVEALAKYQTPSGGWGYYDFETLAQRPSWATSFTTAAAILALLDARAAGLEIPPRMLEGAVRAVERCRLPSGAYTYSVDPIPSPGGAEWIDQVKGSLSRIQVCNVALARAGSPVSVETFREGLDAFFEEHRFLDVARKKPYPHEAYYLNSGYFYFFGHWYAALAIEHLPEAEREGYRKKLAREVVKCQEKDGSMWDFYVNTYHRPYGTAFGVLALAGTVD